MADGESVQRLPRVIAAGGSRLGIPAAPAYAGEASLVRRQRPPGLPLVRGDDVLRLADLLLEFGNRLLCLAAPGRLGGLANGKPGSLDGLQGVTELPELGPVPRNRAVAIYRHANPPDSPPNLARMGQSTQPLPISTRFCHRSDRARAFKQQTCVAICRERGPSYHPGGAKCPLGAMERAMGDVDFDRIIDAVRKEIAGKDSLTGLWGAHELSKAVGDKQRSRRRESTPIARIRRVGEGRKRYR